MRSSRRAAEKRRRGFGRAVVRRHRRGGAPLLPHPRGGVRPIRDVRRVGDVARRRARPTSLAPRRLSVSATMLNLSVFTAFTENPTGGPHPPARGGGKSYARPAPPLSLRNVQSSASRTASTSPTRGGRPAPPPPPPRSSPRTRPTRAATARSWRRTTVARSATRPLRSRDGAGSALAPAPAPESAAPPASSAISQRSPAWPTRTMAPRAACSASTAMRGSYELLRDAKCTASAPTGAGPRSSAAHRRDTSARVANIASASPSDAGAARSGNASSRMGDRRGWIQDPEIRDRSRSARGLPRVCSMRLAARVAARAFGWAACADTRRERAFRVP